MKIEVEVRLVITVEADDAVNAFEEANKVLDILPSNAELKMLGILTDDVPDGEGF